MWHMTHGGRWIFSKNVRSLAFTVWEWSCSENISTKDHWPTDSLNESMTNVFVEQPRLHRICLNILELLMVCMKFSIIWTDGYLQRVMAGQIISISQNGMGQRTSPSSQAKLYFLLIKEIFKTKFDFWWIILISGGYIPLYLQTTPLILNFFFSFYVSFLMNVDWIVFSYKQTMHNVS